MPADRYAFASIRSDLGTRKRVRVRQPGDGEAKVPWMLTDPKKPSAFDVRDEIIPEQ
jgi:hypothetical protein